MNKRAPKPTMSAIRHKYPQRITILIVVISAAAVGIYLLASGYAQTFGVSQEAETGSLGSGGRAAIVNDSNASDGKSVRFGSATNGPRTPAQILNLSNWYLTLPTGSPDATMIMQPALQSYQSSFFKATPSGDGVIFNAPVSGSTTSGSKHTRSELRETAADGTLPWGWPASSGSHVMRATQSISHLPGGKGLTGFAQIHGPGSVWYLILLASGNSDGTAKLTIKDETGKVDNQVIEPRYVLGTKFDIRISVVNGKVTVDYNGVQKVSTTSSLKDSYFKAGIYNQSSGDYGQVEIYSLSVTHQ